MYRSYQRETNFFKREEVCVSCIGGSQADLRGLFSECRTAYLNSLQNKTSIFEHQDGNWDRSKAKNIRQISSVIMNEKEKQALLEKVQEFLDEGNRGWYSRRGIPYNLGLLFYGPPGTGKSSFSLSLAGYFGMDIYVVNLANVNDDTLARLFGHFPQRCIVLLEDIDAVGTSRPEGSSTEEFGEAAVCPGKKTKTRGKVSMSGLLNVLDGVSSQEGRILIMTTNHIEQLDAALIRPGRIDKQVQFPYADKDVTGRLFCGIFKKLEGDIHGPEKPAEDDEMVERFAKEFASEVPEREFSAAEIQSYLLENKRSPRMAVESVQQWITRVRKERKARRADSWGFLGA